MSDDARIASIIGAWREQLDRGEDVDPQQLIAEHPDLADELRVQFDALSQMRHAQAARKAHTKLRTLPIDRYSEFRPAGEGGMGIVYWAIDSDLNREVAFKIIRPDTAEGPPPAPDRPTALTRPVEDTPASRSFEAVKQRFLQEAWITSGMAHPGIVPVHELGETPEGVPYYTMRFIKGKRTLATAIAESRRKPVHERLALLEAFLKICDTLRYAHARGVIHRDLKPENIALGEFGEVVLLDWGLAKLKGSAELADDRLQAHVEAYRDATDLKTIAGAMGTPGYMAPEAALGDSERMDERSDVYSLGVMLFEILTGRLPFEFTTFGELAMKLLKEDAPWASAFDDAVPEALAHLCARCLARDMDRRPPNADALATAVRSWQREDAARQEVRALLREADTALDGAAGLAGEALLRQLDRVTALSRRVLGMRKNHARARRMLRTCERIRHDAIAEREAAVREAERQARKRMLVRFASAAALVALVGAAVAALLLDSKRREAEAARGRTGTALARMEEERNAKARALEEAQAERDAKQAALAATQAERDAKEQALERAQIERDAKVAALGRVEAERDAKARALEKLQAEQRARETAEAEAQTERGAKNEEVRRKRALKLVNASIAAQREDAMRALLLAREAARIQMLPEVATRLHGALGASLERAEFRGHQGEVLSVVLAPKGDRVLTTSVDGSARLWDLEGRQLAVLEGHSGPVRTASFSPRDGSILTPSDDGTARLWDANGRPLAVLRGHAKIVTSAAFSPTGKRIVTASEDGTARLWDLRGKETAVLAEHTGPVISAVFSPKGDYILTASNDGTARLWDVNGKRRRLFARHRGALVAALFSPSGRQVLTASVDGTARLWDEKGTALCVLDGHAAALTAAAFSHSGQRILTASADGKVRLWSLEGEMLGELRGHRGAVTSVSFSPSGRRLFTASADKTVRVWDRAGAHLRTVHGHTAGVNVVAFVAPTNRLLTASADGTARLWSLDGGELGLWNLRGTEAEALAAPASAAASRGNTPRTAYARVRWQGVEVARIETFKGTPGRVRFVDGGRKVCVVSAAKRWIQHYDLSGKLVWRRGYEGVDVVSPACDRVVIRGSANPRRVGAARLTVLVQLDHTRTRLGRGIRQPRPLVFSPSGRHLLGFVGASLQPGARPSALVWDQEGRRIARFEIKGGSVWFAAVSPTGKAFFTLTSDGVGRIWSLSTKNGMPIENLPTSHTHNLRWGEFSPTGDHFLTLGGDRKPTLADTDGHRTRKLSGHEGSVRMAAFSAAGDRIATAGDDGTARLWNIEGTQLAVLRGHDGGLHHIAFSPDGNRIITAAADRTARIWDLDGKELAVLEGHKGLVKWATFSPDGETVLTASEKSIRLWHLEAQAPTTKVTRTHIAYRAGVSPEGDRVITCSGDHTPRLWGPSGLIAVLEGHVKSVRDVMFAGNGESIVSLTSEGVARLWSGLGQPRSRPLKQTLRQGQEGAVRLVGGGPTVGTYVVRLHGAVYLWDLQRNKATEYQGHTGPVLSACVSANARCVLTTSADGTARLFQTGGAQLDVLAGHKGPVQVGAFAPDGEHVATAAGRLLHIWGASGQRVALAKGHAGRIHSIAFSPSGGRVLTASADRTARLWDLNGKELAVLRGHDWDVLSAVFSPSGKRILTASKDKTARIWDLQGKQRAILRGHDGWVGQALYLAAGKRILTVSEDGTARVWFADEDDLVKLASARILRDFTSEERARYADLLPAKAER